MRFLPERAGANKHQHLARQADLSAQLVRRPAGKLGDRFVQVFQTSDRTPERAGAGNFLLARRRQFQLDARQALQLAHCALQHHRPAPAHHRWVEPGQVEHGVDAAFAQLRGDVPAHAPDFVHGGPGQHLTKNLFQ